MRTYWRIEVILELISLAEVASADDLNFDSPVVQEQ